MLSHPTNLLILILLFGVVSLFFWFRHRRSLHLTQKLKEELAKSNQTVDHLERNLAQAEDELHEQRDLNQKLDRELAIAQTQLEMMQPTQSGLREQFTQTAHEVLHETTQKMVNLTKDVLASHRANLGEQQQSVAELVQKTTQPLSERLLQFQAWLEKVENRQHHQLGGLSAMMDGLQSGQATLFSETQKLQKVLANPGGRGTWGEIQLQRVVECAGFKVGQNCFLQPHIKHPDGDLRPDMILKLHLEHKLIIDAKAPIQALMNENDTKNDLRHAKHLKTHIESLARKQYAQKIRHAFPRVVLFLPAEALLSRALAAEPNLFELAWRRQILLATPMTLLALLTMVQESASIFQLENQSFKLLENVRSIHTSMETLVDLLGDLARNQSQNMKKIRAIQSHLEQETLNLTSTFSHKTALGHIS